MFTGACTGSPVHLSSHVHHVAHHVSPYALLHFPCSSTSGYGTHARSLGHPPNASNSLSTCSLTHSLPRSAYLRTPPPILFRPRAYCTCAHVQIDSETACARRSDALHTVTVPPISKQRVVYAPQTRAGPCFVTGNRDWVAHPRTTIYCILYYYIRGFGYDARTDGWLQSAWQRRLRILSAFF